MRVERILMGAAVAVSIAGVSYAALSTHAPTRKAPAVATAADCRTVDTAIAAYLAQTEAYPTTVAQIQPLVRGDISNYRIVNGLAAGPGCTE